MGKPEVQLLELAQSQSCTIKLQWILTFLSIDFFFLIAFSLKKGQVLGHWIELNHQEAVYGTFCEGKNKFGG